MADLMQKYGFGSADILIPGPESDLYRYAVVACDQFTSDREYWASLNTLVADAPSTLRMIVPEVYLTHGENAELEGKAARTMDKYLSLGILRELPQSLVYVRRATQNAPLRRGIVGAFDLEAYDYAPGSLPRIRPTERTIEERLPARVRVRENAGLECPHIMMLVDDPTDALMGALEAGHNDMERLYATPLNKGGGRVEGYKVNEAQMAGIDKALSRLKQDMLFAVGDGNHSLAAAKLCWERLKPTLSPEQRLTHPMRYCLAEVVNIYDPGITFHPIHRLISVGDSEGFAQALAEALGGAKAQGSVRIITAASSIPVNVEVPEIVRVQEVLDSLCARYSPQVDYVHEEETCLAHAAAGGVAVLLPAFDKSALFPLVRSGSVLPRKAFSMGEGSEKRYYLECRKLI